MHGYEGVSLDMRVQNWLAYSLSCTSAHVGSYRQVQTAVYLAGDAQGLIQCTESRNFSVMWVRHRASPQSWKKSGNALEQRRRVPARPSRQSAHSCVRRPGKLRSCGPARVLLQKRLWLLSRYQLSCVTCFLPRNQMTFGYGHATAWAPLLYTDTLPTRTKINIAQSCRQPTSGSQRTGVT